MTMGSIDRIHQASTTALGGNIPYAGIEWRATRSPEYNVFIYNVSQRTFKEVGRIRMTIQGVTETDPVIPGMAANQQYHYVTSFPQPIMLSRPNLESNEMGFVEADVRRFVVDLINPDNLTLSLDTVVPANQVFSQGNNYAQKGVFFDYTNPPSKEQVQKAIDRMESYYKGLLERAQILELTDKAKLSEELGGNPDYAYAANYFGKDVSWNRKQIRPVECPNCGEQKTFGKLFHISSAGFPCVEPTVEGWKAAVRAGAKRYDDVPEEFRWKEHEQRGKKSVADLAKELKDQQ